MDYTGTKLLNVIICNRQAREKLVVCFKLTFAVCKKRECFNPLTSENLAVII